MRSCTFPVCRLCVRVIPLGSVATLCQGSLFCQRLKHIRTPLCNRNLGYFDELISAPMVPLLRDAVDRLSVFERVVAFSVFDVDRLPRRQDEDRGTVLVLREPHTQLAVVQGGEAIE